MKTTMLQRETAPQAKRVSGGNQSAKSLPSHTIVHAKLEMTEPGDHDEREADAMANTIMSGGKIARKISSGGSGSSGIAVSQQMESQLTQLQGSGRPMPQGLQNMMESGFGQSFGQVRIHTDAEAAGMSSSIHAKAFTLGNDIYFNQGQFSPNTSEGQKLMAHELTHVVQGTGKVGRDEDYINQSSQQTFEELSTSLKDNSYYQELKNSTDKTLTQGYIQEGITVAIIISEQADHNGAFSNSTYGALTDPNSPSYGKIIVLQGNSIPEIEQLLKKCEMIGPLKNLIISGHGNWDSITIGKNDYNNLCSEEPIKFSINENSLHYQATLNFFETVNALLSRARKQNIENQTIYLNSCLTNSHQHSSIQSKLNFKEVFQQSVGNSVKIYANSASSVQEQDISVSSDNTITSITDGNDNSILNQNNIQGNDSNIPPTTDFPGSNVYKGTEPKGRIRAIQDEFILNRDLDSVIAQISKLKDNIDHDQFKFNNEYTTQQKQNMSVYLLYTTSMLKSIQAYMKEFKVTDDISNSSYFVIIQLIINYLYGLELYTSKGFAIEPKNLIIHYSNYFLNNNNNILLRRLNNAINTVNP